MARLSFNLGHAEGQIRCKLRCRLQLQRDLTKSLNGARRRLADKR